MVKINIISLDTDTYYTHKKIKISSSRSFETPIKAISPQNLRNNINLIYNKFINEIYITFTKKRLRNLINQGYDSFIKSLGKQLSKLKNIDNKANILIPALRTLYPSIEDLEFLVDIQSFPHFDFYVVPLLEKTKEMRIIEKQYKKIVANFIEILDTRNNKEIMGTLPLSFSPNEVRELLKFYHSLGINTFCFDFEGKVAFSVYPTLSMIQGFFKKEEIVPFIHATNVNIGKPSRKSNIIIAKDILTFGFGIDSLGDDHKPKGGSNKNESLKTKDENLRIFNKDGYSYHKVSPTYLDKIYPIDTKVPRVYLIKGPIKKRRQAQKTLNYEQLGLETLRIRKKIDEYKIIPYVSAKKYVQKRPDLIKIIRIIRNEQLDTFSFLNNIKIK